MAHLVAEEIDSVAPVVSVVPTMGAVFTMVRC